MGLCWPRASHWNWIGEVQLPWENRVQNLRQRATKEDTQCWYLSSTCLYPPARNTCNTHTHRLVYHRHLFIIFVSPSACHLSPLWISVRNVLLWLIISTNSNLTSKSDSPNFPPTRTSQYSLLFLIVCYFYMLNWDFTIGHSCSCLCNGYAT